jgi:diphthamide synthase (EF-2-diphthine--ammonia ligase)
MATAGRAWVSWSSGKDSAYALHAAREAGLAVEGLLTTLDAGSGRVPIHGVASEPVQAQAQALQLPLHTIELPWPCPNDMLRSGLRAVVVAVDPARLPDHLVGHPFDHAFLEGLPDVDPCGENGEFHTFVLDGPGFTEPVDIDVARE